MTGNYLFWAKGLASKAKVIRIAEATGRHRRWVASTLMEFWEWVEGQTTDGAIPALSVRSLSASVPETDEVFWQAVVSVGWIIVDNDGIVIPKFERWLGKSAKRRWQEAERKRLARNNPNQDGLAPAQSVRSASAFCPHDVRLPIVEESRVLNTLPPTPFSEKEDKKKTDRKVASLPEAAKQGTPPVPPPPPTTAAPTVAVQVVAVSRGYTASEYPELAPVAKRVVEHYITKVTAAHTRAGAVPAVIERLVCGVSESKLRNAALGYAEFCSKPHSHRDARHREAARKFYGPDGSCDDFLDWQPRLAAPRPQPAQATESHQPVSAKDEVRPIADFWPEIRARMTAADVGGNTPPFAQDATSPLPAAQSPSQGREAV